MAYYLPWLSNAAVASGGIVSDSPTFLVVTPGNDQLTADWVLPTTLIGGGVISGDPITSQTVRWGTTVESVAIGGTPTGSYSASASAITYTITGLANATLYYVTVTATNSSGESDTTFAVSGTTT